MDPNSGRRITVGSVVQLRWAPLRFGLRGVVQRFSTTRTAHGDEIDIAEVRWPDPPGVCWHYVGRLEIVEEYRCLLRPNADGAPQPIPEEKGETT